MNRTVHVHSSGDSTIISVDDAITFALPFSIYELEDAISEEKFRLGVRMGCSGMTVTQAQE